jgi:predicted permease
MPVTDQDNLVVAQGIVREGVKIGIASTDFGRVLEETQTLQEVAGVVRTGATLAPFQVGDRTMLLRQVPVTGEFFTVLDPRPALGRLLRPEDDVVGAMPVVVISYDAWTAEFGGDPSIIGRTITDPYSRRTYTIVGVGPAGLDYPVGVDAWVPIAPFGWRLLEVVARTRPGVTIAAVRADLLTILRRIDEERPTPVGIAGADVEPLIDATVGHVRPTLSLVVAAVLLLFLITCVNVSGLVLLRSQERAGEFATRRALGASRGQILSQLVSEATILAIAAGIAGLLIAITLLRLFPALSPVDLPRVDAMRQGVPSLAAAGIAALLCLLLCSLLPLRQASGIRLSQSVRSDERSGFGPGRQRLRRLIVGAQAAISVFLLFGAGLLIRSFQRLQHVELGYEAEDLSVLQVSMPFRMYDTPERIADLFDAFAPSVRAVPGVVSVTPILLSPFQGNATWTFRFETDDRVSSQVDGDALIPIEIGGPDYFDTFQVPILRGRGFLAADREGAPRVAIVSRAAADLLWPNENPIGKRLKSAFDTAADWLTVVGVAGDIRFRSLRESTPTIFLPWRQSFWQGLFAVRTEPRQVGVFAAIRRAVVSNAPQVDVWRVDPMSTVLGRQLAAPKLYSALLSAFGLIALVLAALGLYGMLAAFVNERRREIGIRMALGSTPHRQHQEIIARAVVVTGAGMIVGVSGALAASRAMAAALFGIHPADPVTIVAACSILLLVTFATALIPARRATHVDPAEALRAR